MKKWLSPTWRKLMILIYDEARGRSELALEIYGERFPQRIVSDTRTFVNVVQHLRDFGRFEMNKRDLGRQQEDRISSSRRNSSRN
jgi:RNA processing factor Prp31